MTLGAEPRTSTRATPRSVLMVLYHYPPLGGISTSRNACNVEYFPRNGWEPVVLTPRHPQHGPNDPSTLGLVQRRVRVVRTASLEAGHVRTAVAWLRDVLAGLRGGPLTSSACGTNDARMSDNESGASRALGLDWLRHLVFFPDDEVGWLPFGLATALRVHRSTPFDAIYTTSSPITAHLIGGMVKRLTGVPWVAEFRDPWIGNALMAPLPWFHRRLQTKIERWIVRNADRIVCVTPSLTRMYRARYPRASVVTVTNGYDRREVVSPGTAREPRDRFRIVYAGTLDRPEELRVFLEGLDRLLTRRPDLSDRLELAFYGTVSEGCRELIRGFTAEGHLGRVVRLVGFVPRSEALDVIANADAALVLLGDGPGMELFVPGKLHAYLGQNVQVLAMLPAGDARNVLDGLGWGIVAAPDPPSVERAVERLIDLRKPNRLADPDRLYEREALAGLLAATLDDAASACSTRLETGSVLE